MIMDSPGEVTVLLHELNRGNKDAWGRLMPLVYEELRRLAAHYLQAERVGHTLQPTALVHEAYLRLVDQEHADWQNRAQFLAVAAVSMRRILVDYARAHGTTKRAGTVCLDVGEWEPSMDGSRAVEILAVDEALDQLAMLDPRQAKVVELRYFAGLTVKETAEALGVSPRTVKGDWAMAAAWLRTEFGRGTAQQ
jgi:RNA polymerase sigma factor (TIGR02999 family)